MKPVLIFDFDGTLVDTLDLWLNSFEKLSHKYGHHHFNKEGFQDLLELGAIDIMRSLNISVFKFQSIRKDIINLYRRHINDIKLYRGMKKALQAASKGAVLCVITSNFSEVAYEVLEKNGVSHLFSEISGIDAHRSKHGAIKHIMKEYEGKFYFIGDTVNDIKEARKAKVAAVAATWGFQDRERLEKEKPDILLNQPENILKLVK